MDVAMAATSQEDSNLQCPTYSVLVCTDCLDSTWILCGLLGVHVESVQSPYRLEPVCASLCRLCVQSLSRNTLSSDLVLNCMDSGRCRKNVHHQELNPQLPNHIISCDLSELLTITLNGPCGLLYYLCDDHWLLTIYKGGVF